MAETWEMVGVPVLGKLLGCRTVFVAGERRVDKMELLQGRVAAVAVAGRAVVVAAAGVGHHNLAAAETTNQTIQLKHNYTRATSTELVLLVLKLVSQWHQDGMTEKLHESLRKV